jgi:hypothetical protein
MGTREAKEEEDEEGKHGGAMVARDIDFGAKPHGIGPGKNSSKWRMGGEILRGV